MRSDRDMLSSNPSPQIRYYSLSVAVPNVFITSLDCISSLDKGLRRIKVNRIEETFMRENEVCRVATSHDGIPHITTVNYCYVNHCIHFATDYDTRKYRNLVLNRNAAIIIDYYRSSQDNKAVVIQGEAEFIERGSEFRKLYKIFDARFGWVKNDPWEEGEAPFVKIIPRSKVSWGLK